MSRTNLIIRAWTAALLLAGASAYGQQPTLARAAGGTGEGRLTVTLTVVSSVGLVTGPDGEQRMIVANAADARDNVSRLQPVVAVALTPVVQSKPAKAKRKR
jgi:hypothetical protein